MALTRHRAAVFLAIAGAMLLAPARLPGQGLRATYAGALEAIERSEWQDAETLLRRALEQRSREARRLTLRGINYPYLPHFYLGVVRQRQGDCRGALDAWRRSEDQGVIQRLEAHERLTRYRQACRRRLERLEELSAAAARAIDAAAAAAERLEDRRLEAVMRLPTADGGSLEQRRRTALEQLDEAREGLQSAASGEDLAAAEAAERSAAAAGEALEAVERAARHALEETADRAAVRGRRADEIRALAVRVEAAVGSGTGLPPDLQRRRQELRSLLAAARSLPPTATDAQLDGLERRLAEVLERLERAPAGPPATLRAAAAAWLRGDYHEVIERLEEIPYRDPKNRGHCLLLRAAAHHALHALDDEPAGLTRARADLRELRATLPGLAPSSMAFSPDFLRLFELTGARPGEAGG